MAVCMIANSRTIKRPRALLLRASSIAVLFQVTTLFSTAFCPKAWPQISMTSTQTNKDRKPLLNLIADSYISQA